MSNEGNEQTLTRLSVMFLPLLHEESCKISVFQISLDQPKESSFENDNELLVSDI